MGEWEERFARLVERKTNAAIAAALPPYRTAFDRAAPPLEPIGLPWTRSIFDGNFYVSPPPADDLPSASLVFVQSQDGNTGAKDPSDLGGGLTDKHLVYEGLSRVSADAVLAGAETIRGGSLIMSVWHPELVALRQSLGLPRHPVQIVASLRGLDFTHGLLFNLPELPVIVLTVPSCSPVMHDGLARRPWIEPVFMQNSHDLAAAFRRLRARGITRLSAIGGRSVARALAGAGLIQDLYLTTSPKSGGEPDTRLFTQRPALTTVVRKHGTGPEEGVVFEHARFPDSPMPPFL